jgi:hypothetical protein
MPEPELRTEPVAIKASPLPPASAEDPLTKDQWRTLLALADTVIPSIVPESPGQVSSASVRAISAGEYASAAVKVENYALQGGETGLAKSYLDERASHLPEFKRNVSRFLGLHTPYELRKLLAFGLNTLK